MYMCVSVCVSSGVDNVTSFNQCCAVSWQVDLTFSEDALAAIADEASRMKTGARGLRSIMV